MRLPLLAIALVSCALYANTLPGDLVWDDAELLSQQPLVREPGSVLAIFGSPYWGPTDYLYRPLTVWTLAWNHGLNSALGLAGQHAVSFHLFNVLLHAAVCCALFRFLRSLALSVWPSMAAALLFAAHPIHTEVVAQIVGRSELLAALGGLLFLTLHRTRRSAAGAAAFLLLALWSKESAIAFLPLAIWMDVCFPGEERRPWWRGYGAYGVVTAGWLALRSMAIAPTAQGIPFLDNPLAYASTPARLWTACGIQLDYLRLQLLPVGLSADYSFHEIPVAFGSPGLRLLGFAALLCAAGVAAWSSWRRHRIVSFCIVGYAILFGLTSNVLVPVGTVMGERLAYSPSLLALTLAAYALFKLRLRAAPAVTALLGVILILSAGLTIARNRTWSDADRFARELVAAAPNSAKAHYTLAGRLQTTSSLDEALDELDVAVSIYPSYAEAWNRMGAIQHERRDYRAAVESLHRATAIFPGFVEALYRLGLAHQSIDELDEAAAAYLGALALDATLVEALTNLGSVYARQGRLDEAERLWVEALELSPEHTAARVNLDQLRELRRP